jgi:Sulfotransferase domain
MSDPHADITGPQLLDVWYKDHAGGPDTGGKPHMFVCCGLHSSGSAWMFNLVREICRSQAVAFESCHRESVAKLPRDALRSKLIVVKSHTPMDDLRWLLINSGEPVVITVRDPRDAVVSLMQRFGNDFSEALDSVAVSAERLATLSRLRTIPVFRYEDGYIGRVETFDRIAALLGVGPSADQRDAILAELEPKSVERTISHLIAAGVIRPSESVHDAKTQWHANHVGDGKIGKFIGVLSPAQRFEIEERTREFCKYFGYDMTIDITIAGMLRPIASSRIRHC